MTSAQFKNEVINRRVEVLQNMDYAIRFMNDESVMEPWLMEGVPDGADLDDYQSIAEDHDEYIYIVKLFAKLVAKYAKEDF